MSVQLHLPREQRCFPPHRRPGPALGSAKSSISIPHPQQAEQKTAQSQMTGAWQLACGAGAALCSAPSWVPVRSTELLMLETVSGSWSPTLTNYHLVKWTMALSVTSTLQGLGFHHILRHSIPMLNHALCEEIPPDVPPESPLLQVEALSSHCLAGCLGEITVPHLATPPFQGAVGRNNLSEPPLLG